MAKSHLSPFDDDNLLTTQFKTDITKPTHPVYELRWLSRGTYRRYRKRSGFSEVEKEHLANREDLFLERDGDAFVTKSPHPITRERTPWSGTSRRLPEAQPGSILKVEDKKIFCDIEFNDLNPVPK